MDLKKLLMDSQLVTKLMYFEWIWLTAVLNACWYHSFFTPSITPYTHNHLTVTFWLTSICCGSIHISKEIYEITESNLYGAYGFPDTTQRVFTYPHPVQNASVGHSNSNWMKYSLFKMEFQLALFMINACCRFGLGTLFRNLATWAMSTTAHSWGWYWGWCLALLCQWLS